MVLEAVREGTSLGSTKHVSVTPGLFAAQVSVYSLQSEKLVKTLLLDPSLTLASQIESISFSENSKLLLTQCGEPDYTLLIWRWYSAKVRRQYKTWLLGSARVLMVLAAALSIGGKRTRTASGPYTSCLIPPGLGLWVSLFG